MHTNHYISSLICFVIYCGCFFQAHLLFSKKRTAGNYTIREVQDLNITIDGELSEAFWKDATAILLRHETNPGNNRPAEVVTELRMAYDRQYLYFSFKAIDPDPKAIRAIITDRDRLDDNDFITLVLDPFNDSRRAFFFSVNPLGVQQDGVYDEQSGNGDLSWDAIWNSSAKITEEGYVTEAAIPFKSLRFPNNGSVQTWRFYAVRNYPRSIEKIFHNMPIDQDNSCLLCQADLVSGFENIQPGTNLEFTPTFVFNKTSERDDFPDGDLEDEEGQTNFGLDVRWGITTDLIFNLAVNPDFSQVEADAAQLDVNTRFTLQFPEKRPFFLEGADLFNTPIQAFFSRSIADPSYGTKLSGKIEKNAIGILVAEDALNNLILPEFQSSEAITVEERITNLIGRYRRDIGKNHNAGIMYTGREGNEYYNRVGGVDMFFRPWNPITIRAQYLHSQSRYDSITAIENDLVLNSFDGNAAYFDARYDTRDWNSRFIFEHRDPGFRADAGFVPQVDLQRFRYYIERVFWGSDDSWYANIGWNAGGFRRQSTRGVLDVEGIWTSAFLNGPLQLNYWINPDLIWQQLNGITYRLERIWSGFDIQPLGNLGINGWMNLGDAVDFANGGKADNFQFWLETDIRIGKHIEMSLNHRYSRLFTDEGSIFTANLSQIQAAYNFSTRLFLKSFLQYRHTERNPELYSDPEVNDLEESFFAQVILSYKLNPQSVIFLGYVDNQRGFDNQFENIQVPLIRENSTFFFKVGYAWRP